MVAALSDDLNTPDAIAAIARLSRLDDVGELAAHDQHHAVRPGGDRIGHGEVEEDLALRADLDELLVAAEAAAHAGGHEHQCECHRVSGLLE